MSRISSLIGDVSMEMITYVALYNYCHIFEMQSASNWVWLAAALGYDLGWYVTHRLSHEMNFGWAAHQTHHSSEYYNLTTALRQSMWHKYFTFPAFMVMALLGIPPTQFLLHREFSILGQFWLHTENIGKMWWPIEFIFNTPSHHRVHHGRNPYCEGLYIVFSTFQSVEIYKIFVIYIQP